MQTVSETILQHVIVAYPTVRSEVVAHAALVMLTIQD